jgi:hypothetical protein
MLLATPLLLSCNVTAYMMCSSAACMGHYLATAVSASTVLALSKYASLFSKQRRKIGKITLAKNYHKIALKIFFSTYSGE